MQKGKLTPEQFEQRINLIAGTLSYAEIAEADIVIEAVFEDMGVKETVFRKLDAVMKPGAILASNTSTLDLDQIAGFTQRPQDVIGTAFFQSRQRDEAAGSRARRTNRQDVLATVMALSKKIKKPPWSPASVTASSATG